MTVFAFVADTRSSDLFITIESAEMLRSFADIALDSVSLIQTIESSRFLPYQRILKFDFANGSACGASPTDRAPSGVPSSHGAPVSPVCVRENKTSEPSGNSKMARLPSVNTQF